MVIYTLGLAVLESTNLHAACEFNHLHDTVCYWPLLLRNQPTAHFRVLCCCWVFSIFICKFRSARICSWALKTSLEKDMRYLEAAIQKCWVGLCRRCSLGNFTTMQTYLQREKGLFIDMKCLFTHSWLWKTMFGLSAWAKVDHEFVAEELAPWVSEGAGVRLLVPLGLALL